MDLLDKLIIESIRNIKKDFIGGDDELVAQLPNYNEIKVECRFLFNLLRDYGIKLAQSPKYSPKKEFNMVNPISHLQFQLSYTLINHRYAQVSILGEPFLYIDCMNKRGLRYICDIDPVTYQINPKAKKYTLEQLNTVLMRYFIQTIDRYIQKNRWGFSDFDKL